MIKIISKRPLHPLKSYYSSSLKTHYQLLQVDSSASFKEIKDKYILKSKMYHPDISPNSSHIYHNIQTAYKVLSAPQSRKKYDLSLGMQYSLWEKEMLGEKFKPQFQMEGIYSQILNQEKYVHQSSSVHRSVEDRLCQQFKGQISNFNARKIFKDIKFISMLVGMSVFWFIWSGAQIFWLNYAGKKVHKIQKVHTDTALKVIPLFSR